MTMQAYCRFYKGDQSIASLNDVLILACYHQHASRVGLYVAIYMSRSLYNVRKLKLVSYLIM